MPYKDKANQVRAQRFYIREKRHPNWRQTYINANGMCVNCSEVEGLEFHEPFGEDHNGDGKMQVRSLLCNSCHYDEHIHEGYSVNRRPYPSMLQEDVAWEMAKYGGVDNWEKAFGLCKPMEVNECV